MRDFTTAEIKCKVGFSLPEAKRAISSRVRTMVRPEIETMIAALALEDQY